MEPDEHAPASSARRLLRNLGPRGPRKPPSTPPQTRWRSRAQERIYCRRLLEALRTTIGSGATGPRRPPFLTSSQAVKEAADSVLATTGQRRTRWSRAVLKRKFRVRKQVVLKKASNQKGRSGGSRSRLAFRGEKRRTTWETTGMNGRVGERLQVLSRLVPGCKKASPTELLEEAADYLAALELQVRALRSLADSLSSVSSTFSVAAPQAYRPPPALPGSP